MTSNESMKFQRGRCNNPYYKSFPNPCLACASMTKRGIDSSPCRFLSIRAFKQEGTKLTYGPFFATQRNSGMVLYSIPNNLLLNLTMKQQEYIREALRPTVKRLVQRDALVMLEREDSLRQRKPTNNLRHNCDHCHTSIFNVYFMCSICGMEICMDCLELESEWTVDDIAHNNNNNNNNNNNKIDVDILLEKNVDTCTFGRRHNKADFFPISKYPLKDMEQLLYQTCSRLSNYHRPSPLKSISSSPIAESTFETRSSTVSPLNITKTSPNTGHPLATLPSAPPELSFNSNPVPHQHQLLVISQKDLDLTKFQSYWQTGKPAIIQDTLDRSKIAWTPDFLCSMYGQQKIDAIDCRNMEGTTMTISDFFQGYISRQPNDNSTPVLKIKDWPPGSDFRTECPEMFEDFMAMLPVPEYCTTDGIFNLSNRLPPYFVQPDLGPKMFIAYGLDPLDDTCLVGTTNLHCDMTDAVNVMCHVQQHDNSTTDGINNNKYDLGVSSTPGKAAAVWDIFAYDDLPILRQFVAQLWDEMKGTQQSARKVDPIHGQWIYLTKALLNRLYNEHGVTSWRLYQNLGDAIYIPAGCAHQVANYQNAIKCAVDFISPENIERSAAITRQLGNARREDALQLNTTLIFSWMSVYDTMDLSTTTTDDIHHVKDDVDHVNTTLPGKQSRKTMDSNTTDDDQEPENVNPTKRRKDTRKSRQ